MTTDRIVLSTAGFLVLTSLALGYFVSPYWYLLTAFVGVNLFQAGLTGFCPMVKFLQKCPPKNQKSCCGSHIETVDSKTLKQWLDNDEAIVIDVREVEEYNRAHIKGAILIPVGTCSASSIPHNPNKKIVFQCKAGVRGHKACEICVKAVPDGVVYNLEGGLDAWIAGGYPVESV